MKEAFFLLLQKFGGEKRMFTENLGQGINVKGMIKATNKMLLQALVEWDYFQPGSQWLRGWVRENFVKNAYWSLILWFK